MPRRIYLDNAATSFPKPPGVYEAMVRYGQQVGGTAGRGNYAEAREGGRVISQCRTRLCDMFGGESQDHVVFALNTTDALNLAIKGVVLARRRREPGKAVRLVASRMDHNSVLRPLNALAERGEVEWTCVDVDETTGLIDPRAIRDAVRPDTALVALVHASNVTGVVQPAAEIGAICRERGVLLMVDAAQTLGHCPVDVGSMNIDLLAFPGHKGAMGPLGTAGLYIRPGVEELVDPVREGGTGSRSEEDRQPRSLPDKYESGSQNAVGIAGLSEGIAWHLEHREKTGAHERRLREVMLEGLAELDALGLGFGRWGLRLIGPATADGRVGVFSMIHESLSAHELAAILEQEFGVLGRAGLHCAPRAHKMLGTIDRGGALRLSFGPFVTEDDVRFACRAVGEVIGARRPELARPNP